MKNTYTVMYICVLKNGNVVYINSKTDLVSLMVCVDGKGIPPDIVCLVL